MLNVLLFAGLAEAAGTSKVRLDLTLPVQVADAKRALSEQVPTAAGGLASAFAAINHQYAGDEAWINPGDEVAFLPPVSGG